MKTADVCLQEPKLRKMGQALFIPARDYDVLTWHPLGFSQTTQPKYKNRDQHDFSPCAGATAGCLFFSYTNKSWQTSYNQALSWCTTLCPMLAAQMIKNLPAMQESQVPSLGWEDPLEKQMATHSSVPAWKIPWTEESGGLQLTGSQRVRHDWVTNTLIVLYATHSYCWVNAF